MRSESRVQMKTILYKSKQRHAYVSFIAMYQWVLKNIIDSI